MQMAQVLIEAQDVAAIIQPRTRCSGTAYSSDCAYDELIERDARYASLLKFVKLDKD